MTQASRYLKVRSGNIPLIANSTVHKVADAELASDTSTVISTGVQLPSMANIATTNSGGSQVPDADSSLEALVKREALLLRRVQTRSNSILTPTILINLELAAYYLLVLMNVCP